MRRAPLLVLLLLAGCGSDESRPSSAPTVPANSSSATPVPELVGRWEQVHTCKTLVAALTNAGLGEVAPAVIGDYFPGQSTQKLARKAEPCAGAKPQRHAHFFSEAGAFGSLDQHDQRVDDGSYEILDDHRFQIGASVFEYTIENGDTLVLHPVITESARSEALAHPREFSEAGWQVAVTYGGQKWVRVDCDGWC